MVKKKIIFIPILIIVLLLAVTACNSNSLGEYKKAAEKTSQITRGQAGGEFTLTTGINTDGLTAEEIQELNYIKDMHGTYNLVFDEEEEKTIVRNYINFGGLGYDFEFYVKGPEMFVKLPVIGKYLRLDEEMISAGEEVFMEEPFISKETKKELGEKWLSLMKEEDVFKGKNLVLTTPDGEVKTTEYSIILTHEQIQALVGDWTEILPKDENLKAFYENNIRRNAEPLENKTFEDFLNDIKGSLDKLKVENFSYRAYVDIDGYIVNEIIEISLKTSDEQEAVSGIDYKLDMKNWDINKDQKFDFPVLTDENTLKMEDMDGNMPAAMEEFFKNKN